MEVTKFQFRKRENDTGKLVFLEVFKDIPFEVKRVYYVFDTAENARRGFHAHKKLMQVYICIHGSCKVLLDDGKEQAIVTLENPAEGLFFRTVIWREIYDFSPGAVLLVLASDYYDENDYVRNYEDFIRYIEENGE